MIFLALPFEFFWRYAKKYRKLAMILTVSFLMGGLYQVFIYFFIWSNDIRTMGGYEKKLYDFGILINELPIHKNNYLILTKTTAISQDRRESSFKSTEYISYPKIKDYIFYRPIDKNNFIDCNDPLIILYESDDWLRNYYKGMCPGSSVHYKTPENGMFGFWYIKK
jgi:hypothetical protein